MNKILLRINRLIKDGSFSDNSSLHYSIRKAHEAKAPLHLVGLVSDGGVHSHIRHLEALIKLCSEHKTKPLLHMITDGRDTDPRCANKYVRHIEPLLKEAGGAIATIIGRFYAMDRDRRWDRTESAWRAIAKAEGNHATSALEAIEDSYASDLSDEFILPTVLPGSQKTTAKSQMILFNFRNDRPRQLVQALVDKDFGKFDRGGDYHTVKLTTITEIDNKLPCLVAFGPQRPKTTLPKIISDHGLKQFHCAETEKYPHVTFFFNGGNENSLPGETRKLIASPKVKTYDQFPEMSAEAVASAVVEAIKDEDFAFVVVNLANMDMVGHTAMRESVIRAVETVDTQIDRIVSAALDHDCTTVITSDHGNCDEMLDLKTQQPHTRHTTNPVPCLVINNPQKDGTSYHLGDGSISNIAPTILDLMGLEIPTEMSTASLILRQN